MNSSMTLVYWCRCCNYLFSQSVI